MARVVSAAGPLGLAAGRACLRVAASRGVAAAGHCAATASPSARSFCRPGTPVLPTLIYYLPLQVPCRVRSNGHGRWGWRRHRAHSAQYDLVPVHRQAAGLQGGHLPREWHVTRRRTVPETPATSHFASHSPVSELCPVQPACAEVNAVFCMSPHQCGFVSFHAALQPSILQVS